jgi:hypothetical protein
MAEQFTSFWGEPFSQGLLPWSRQAGRRTAIDA